jgi:hypothetical protein
MNHPEESIQHSEQGESLKSITITIVFASQNIIPAVSRKIITHTCITSSLNTQVIKRTGDLQDLPDARWLQSSGSDL